MADIRIIESKRYRIEYSGFCIVEADSKEEALELAQDGEVMYDECNWGKPSLCDEGATDD